MSRPKSELKRWAKEHMRGAENTLLPSFTPDLSTLDEDGIRLDVRQAIAHGFFSMMVATETGLSLEESKRMLEIAVDEAGDDIVVTTSVILNSFDENMALVEHAEKVGVRGILLGYPPTFHPSDAEEVYTVTKRFADATKMYVTLYPSPHFPFNRFHPSGFPMEVMDRLADIDNIVAVKAGELGLFADAHRLVGDRLLVGCPVERYVPLLTKGFGMQWMGAGCYEVLQSPDKPYLTEYFDLLLQGKEAAAMELYWKIAPMRNIFEEQFNKIVMTGTYNWHQQKFYQWCVGGNGGLTRQPAMKLHSWEADVIRMGFYAIDIVPRDNDDEFVMGRRNWEKLHGVEGSGTAPVQVSGAASTAMAKALAGRLASILAATEQEVAELPTLSRPMVKTLFSTGTGRSVASWMEAVEGVASALSTGGAVPDGMADDLPKLAGYYEAAPRHAGRFMKGAEAEAFAQSMAERAQVVNDLASQLTGLRRDA